jgi:hypothetical protein
VGSATVGADARPNVAIRVIVRIFPPRAGRAVNARPYERYAAKPQFGGGESRGDGLQLIWLKYSPSFGLRRMPHRVARGNDSRTYKGRACVFMCFERFLLKNRGTAPRAALAAQIAEI